jgi:hypothetical protein
LSTARGGPGGAPRSGPGPPGRGWGPRGFGFGSVPGGVPIGSTGGGGGGSGARRRGKVASKAWHCGPCELRGACRGACADPRCSSLEKKKGEKNLRTWYLEARGKLTYSFFCKIRSPPPAVASGSPAPLLPARTWAKAHRAQAASSQLPHPGRAVGSGQNPLPGGYMLISPDLYVCLCSSTTKKRVSTYSGSIDSSRRVLLAPCSTQCGGHCPTAVPLRCYCGALANRRAQVECVAGHNAPLRSLRSRCRVGGFGPSAI